MTLKNIKLLSIVFIVIILLSVGTWILYTLQQRAYTATINIEVTPLSSIITINSNRTNQGITKVKPGAIIIAVSLPGFTNFTTNINIAAGDTKYIGVILKSNTPNTVNWYEKHLEDQSMAEKITGKQFNITSQEQVIAEPFLKEIPYIAAGFEFKIDYGSPPPGSNKPVIFIQADTQTARDDALVWIRGRGYDPSKLNIVYTTSN